MMRAALALVLAACSSGGSSPTSQFTPTSDIAATHPWLSGSQWTGDGTGPTWGTSQFNLLAPQFSTLTAPTSSLRVHANGLGVDSSSAVLQADGNQIRVEAQDEDGTLRMDLAASADRRTLSGTFAVHKFIGSTDESGTVTLRRVGSLRSSEVWLIYLR